MRTRKDIVRALDEAAQDLFLREEFGHPGERVDQRHESEAKSLIKRAARLLIVCERQPIEPALCDCPKCEADTARRLRSVPYTDGDGCRRASP